MTPTTGARLRYRPRVYRHEAGFLVYGTDTRGRRVRIFTRSRISARRIIGKLHAGAELGPADYDGEDLQ